MRNIKNKTNIYTCSPNWFGDFDGQNYSNFNGQKSKLIMAFTIKNISVTPLYYLCNPFYDSVKILWAACIVAVIFMKRKVLIFNN